MPPCLTPRRPSHRPQNASPKLTPRSTLAGNFGSSEGNRTFSYPTKHGFMHPSGYPSFFWFTYLPIFCFITRPWLFIDLFASNNGVLHHWILMKGYIMYYTSAKFMENSKCHAYLNGFRVILKECLQTWCEMTPGQHMWGSKR